MTEDRSPKWECSGCGYSSESKEPTLHAPDCPLAGTVVGVGQLTTEDRSPVTRLAELPHSTAVMDRETGITHICTDACLRREYERGKMDARRNADAALREALHNIIAATKRTRDGRYIGRTNTFDAAINEALGILATPIADPPAPVVEPRFDV